MDYLKAFKSRPLTSKLDFSGTSCQDLAQTYADNHGKWASPMAVPEREAITFYLLNHGASLVQKRYSDYQPLGASLPIMEAYHEQGMKSAVRMFYYLLLICTRESRHVHKNVAFFDQMANKHGKGCMDFTKKIIGQGSDGAVEKFLDTPPSVGIAKYTAYLTDLFYSGSYSSGYGGKAWGKVAQCLSEFANGKISAEIMLDTAFTLAHNNGPIFNKGMLYTGYNSTAIVTILDVQRSGQIPQLVSCGHDYGVGNYISSQHSEWLQLIAQEYPEVKGHVDWYTVEALGAVGNYSAHKSKQAKAHGLPASEAKLMKIAEAKKVAAEAAKKKKEAELKASYYEVVDGVLVKKLQRSEVA